MPAKKKPSDIHRSLTLASPKPKGTDVKALQKNLNWWFDHFKIERQVAVDGEFGQQTLNATKQIAYSIGAGHKSMSSLRTGQVGQPAQKLIRRLRKRTKLEQAAMKRRAIYRRRLRIRFDKGPGEKVMEWAKAQIGITENPPGSNWGGRISEWITFTGYSFPVYWCGAFACFGTVKIGGAKISNRIRLGLDDYIISDAKAGVNGLTSVPFDSARAGDIAVYTYDHIGLVERVEGDRIFTVEGNTSSGSAGSQSNGGGVFARERSRSEVALIARPNY